MAQSPEDLFSKAPPAIDDALRARASKFYQLQAEGKFRQADDLVAADAKDIYMEADKRRCRKFQIVRINYAEEFSKANVVTNCDTEMLLPPKGITSVTVPLTTFWKSMNGEWFWYVPARDGRDTAFGTMKAGPGEGVSVVTSGPSVQDVLKMVTVDPKLVKFPAANKEVQSVVVTNGMPGEVQLELAPLKVSDLKLEIDRTQLKANETAKITITYEPGSDYARRFGSSEDIRLTVKPLNKVIPIRVVFPLN